MERLRAITLLLLPALIASYASGQRNPVVPRQISGQVTVNSRPAPQGVLVMLDVAGSTTNPPTGSGSAGQTTTDSRGRFYFGNLQFIGVRQGKEYFAITARFPGYRDAVQVVDLISASNGYTMIDLRPLPSNAPPSVPPGGAAATVSAKQPGNERARAELEKGQQLLLEQHDAKGSIEHFKHLVKLDPDYAPGYVLLGTAHMQTGEFADAQAAFEKAAHRDANNAAAYLGIGAALNQQKDYAGAQKALRRSLELKPDSPEAQYEMARSLWAQGQWQQAEPYVRKALQLNRNYAAAHTLMGNVWLRKRDPNTALYEFEESLRLEPEGPQSEQVKQIIIRLREELAKK
jgi:Flp pilus assembly protein TadD